MLTIFMYIMYLGGLYVMYVEPRLDAVYPTLVTPVIRVETDSCLYVDVYNQDSELNIYSRPEGRPLEITGMAYGWGQGTISLPTGTYNIMFVPSTSRLHGALAITNVLLVNRTCVSGKMLFSPIPWIRVTYTKFL